MSGNWLQLSFAANQEDSAMITTEVIFLTQIASLVAFVGTAFFLYRTLVDQKEATIQTKKENIVYLKDQLADAKSRLPDVLSQNLSNRIKLLEQELQRMESDKTSTQEQVKAKEEELCHARQEADRLTKQLRLNARQILEEFVCNGCGAPMLEVSYRIGTIQTAGATSEERDPFAHEILLFECGREIIDYDTWTRCPKRKGEGAA